MQEFEAAKVCAVHTTAPQTQAKHPMHPCRLCTQLGVGWGYVLSSVWDGVQL
jgi:hypothetical protein